MPRYKPVYHLTWFSGKSHPHKTISSRGLTMTEWEEIVIPASRECYITGMVLVARTPQFGKWGLR